ncbi:MAG TPA: MFS transporter [Candidatus Angelobacter sp.]|nr:MFS transporter [Candidatus Angelobacter sp.]
MNFTNDRQHASPARWVPTLYFAEGLPFYTVSLMALIFYQRVGVSNETIALTTSLLGLPWSLKPLWSPFLEVYRTRKFFVVCFEFIGGLSLGLLALCLPLPGYFRYSIALLAVVGFCSSSHDIVADGLYIASLNPKQQSAYAGWQGGFFNVARFFSQGGLIILAGFLEARMPILRAWMIIFGGLGVILVLLGLYHARMLPSGGEDRRSGSIKEVAGTYWDVVARFFQKPNIILLLVFIFLYRAGEGQLVKIGPLFLKAARADYGLGLSTAQFGTIYGTLGTAAFIGGTVLGGYFTSWLGLKRAIVPLIIIMNLPNVAYVYLSTALPANSALIATALSVEMFGYGFGFVGVILLMMQEIAPGKYQAAHYAFANSLMNLGLIVPGALSGYIQKWIGYQKFFIWVLIAAVPALVMARFIPIGASAEQQPTEAKVLAGEP